MNIYTQTPKLDFNHVLILPRQSSLSSRSEVNLNSYDLESRLKIVTNGIIAANMDGVGTMEVADVLKEYNCMTALHKHYSAEELISFFSSCRGTHAFYSMGITDADYEKFKTVINEIDYKNKPYPFKLCIDVANGYMQSVGKFIFKIKKEHPNVKIMAGNVVNMEGIDNMDVSIPKIGIGQGSNCLTRSQTGIGYPQFSAIYDIHNGIETYKGDQDYAQNYEMLCSDGGCVEPADIAKAMAAGADLVMLGGMLAGTDQGGGDIIEVNGRKFVEFYGMSSTTAQKIHNGGVKNYRSSEGRTTLVPYRGDMRDVISNILGGLASTCTYVGAANLDQLRVKSKFIRVHDTINRSMEKYTIGN